MPESVDARVDRLYSLPLDEFTAARNELARELKGSDDATRVKELKKPTRAAGAINRAARSSRRDVKRLLDAADKLAAAQQQLLEGGDRAALRKAVEAEREAVDRLIESVKAELEQDGGAGEAMLERARGTLHAVATDGELREQLDAGRVTEDRTAVGLGGLGAGAPTPAARPSRKKPDRKRQDEARRRLKTAERELDDAERRLGRAEEDLSEARERLKAAESSVKQAGRDRDKAVRGRDAAEASVSRQA